MKRKYVYKKIPIDINNLWKMRKRNIERDLSRMKGGRRVSVTITDVMRLSASTPSFYLDDFINYKRKRRRR